MAIGLGDVGKKKSPRGANASRSRTIKSQTVKPWGANNALAARTGGAMFDSETSPLFWLEKDASFDYVPLARLEEVEARIRARLVLPLKLWRSLKRSH